jgi:hypothetical protein
VLVYDITWVVLLAAFAFLYFNGNLGDIAGPESDSIPFKGIPLYTVWFGMLGGIVVSLKGISDHYGDWDGNLSLWHYARPFTGGAAGAAIYVVLWAVADKEPNPPVALAAGFIVGVAERDFFDLLKNVAKLILRSPDAPSAPGEDQAKTPAGGTAGKPGEAPR